MEAAIESPRPGLEQHENAVLEAVKKYRFEPGRREGQVVPTWMKLSVEFR